MNFPKRPPLLPGDGTDATVSMRVVRGILQAVEDRGVSASQILRACDLDPERLEAPEARMPRAQVFRLCELAMDVTGDPAFGLHWAERITGSSFAPISPLLAHAGTLRQAFDSLLQFGRVLSDRSAYQLIEDADEVFVRGRALPEESLRVQRMVAEMAMVGFLRLARTFQAQARPRRVCFAYPAPPYRAEYARVFEHCEQFEQPCTEIVFDRAVLDATSPQRDEDVHAALRSVVERRIARLGQRMPYAQRVRDLLVAAGPHQADMKVVARELGMSVRSLRRRLTAEGKPYAEISTEAFALVAKHCLCERRLSIQETAYELGFSDTSTFHRAFKRWTGVTPSAFRDSATGRG